MMMMISTLIGIGCLEYEFKAHSEYEADVDVVDEEELGWGEAIVDTAAADTGFEAAIDETEGQATEVMYLHTSSHLFSWNDSGDITEIGPFTLNGVATPGITDLAIDLNGVMYGIARDELFVINAEDASLTFVCELSVELMGLTFLSDGSLMGAGDGIYMINPISGSTATFVADGQYTTSGDIVGHPNGLMYWTVIGDHGEDELVSVDPSTGETTWIGSIGAERLWGVGYFDDNLYGFSSNGSIATINPSNAISLTTKETPGHYWWGAATNPVRWED
ncbi:MAG: hypothetical protein CMK59_09520 [Proteobacteria bacterium]|nr:hypothetical protein [Pseudomonadota bacterium]